ncbi:MAG: hypothetical protein Q8M07_06435 [Prosthecobacter sp.]|nr:hypothetical protein [Prosthecobacter sp.]
MLPSCALNPAWLFDTGMDYDKKRGRMLDTPRNRQELTTSYLSFIRREASGEDPPPWESVWRGIFNALDAGNDNPGFYKNFIIEERRRHGLPKLGFL